MMSIQNKTKALHIQNKTKALQKIGWIVGDRDPRLNRNYPGKFMVVEPHEERELPTDDGSNGPWCVVGDELSLLVEQGFDMAFGMNDNENGEPAKDKKAFKIEPLIFPSVEKTVGLVINAPAVFARPDFMAWLCNTNAVFTWHNKSNPIASECSDVIVLVDANYEGDATCMPQDIWEKICDAAYFAYGGSTIPDAKGAHVAVRLTNLTM